MTYLIYPQQPGTFRLPNAEIPVKYASDPPKSVETHFLLPSVAFEAVIRRGGRPRLLPSHDSLVIKQKLDKPINGLKVGDTFTRTITIAGVQAPGDAHPAHTFEAPAGVAVYPKQPAVDDVKQIAASSYKENELIPPPTLFVRRAPIPYLKSGSSGGISRPGKFGPPPSPRFTLGPRRIRAIIPSLLRNPDLSRRQSRRAQTISTLSASGRNRCNLSRRLGIASVGLVPLRKPASPPLERGTPGLSRLRSCFLCEATKLAAEVRRRMLIRFSLRG